ncbi:hypothetical protein HDR59_03310 [bacterium]|nr:hypothetical protein [bacterium]
MKLRLSNKEIHKLLTESNKKDDFLNACPYKGNKCGSVEPPSYCDKCYKEGKYNINNGRSADEFSYDTPYEMENNQYYKICTEHNEKLARECEFGTGKTCKYKDYWEKCTYCSKEFSR